MNSKDQKIVDSTEKNQSFWEINQQPFRELLTFADFADAKLNIAFAEINFAQDRDLIIEQLIHHPDCQNIQFEILNFPDPHLRFFRDELVSALQQITIDPNKKLILLITGLEKSIGILDEHPDVLVNLNYVRDDFRKSACHPIIFFLPEYALTRLAKYAPDFWAWTRKVFNFKTIKSELNIKRDEILFLENIDSSNLNLSEKASRIDLLLRLLSEFQYFEQEESIKLINIYHELARSFYQLSDYKKTIEYNQKILKIAQEIGDNNSESDSLNNLGVAYDSLGKYQQAIDFYQQSLAILQQIGDLHGESKSLGNLGNAYDSLGEYQQAIEFHQQSLAIFQQIGDLHGESKSLGNLGLVYNSLGEYQRAIKFYQQSLDIKQQLGDRLGESKSLGNLGLAYNSLGEYQRAIDFFHQSLDIKQQIGDRHGTSISLSNLGNAYNSLGEYQRAIDFFQKSLAITQQIGNRHGEANTWFNLGNTLKKIHQKIAAKTAYEKAKKLYQALKLEQDVEDCDRAIENLESE